MQRDQTWVLLFGINYLAYALSLQKSAWFNFTSPQNTRTGTQLAIKNSKGSPSANQTNSYIFTECQHENKTSNVQLSWHLHGLLLSA